MDISSLPKDFNYVEYVVCNNKTGDVIDINLSKEKFEYMMGVVKRQNWKYFGKSCKMYTHNNLIYENYDYTDIKVYSKEIKEAKMHPTLDLITLYCIKDKKPFHMFPSTKSIHSIAYVRKLVFRVHNRVYVNFETIKNVENDNIVYKVYINYNHDKNIDQEYMSGVIESTITALFQ